MTWRGSQVQSLSRPPPFIERRGSDRFGSFRDESDVPLGASASQGFLLAALGQYVQDLIASGAAHLIDELSEALYRGPPPGPMANRVVTKLMRLMLKPQALIGGRAIVQGTAASASDIMQTINML